MRVPYINYELEGVRYILQNGILSFLYLQPTFYIYDLPAKYAKINLETMLAASISKKKKQEVNFPYLIDINPMTLIKTNLGNGQIEKNSINLLSRMNKITLKYATE